MAKTPDTTPAKAARCCAKPALANHNNLKRVCLNCGAESNRASVEAEWPALVKPAK